MKGQVVGGDYSKVIVRQKASEDIEIGELLIAESEGQKLLLQVYDLLYGSQISPQTLELIAGMKIEEDTDFKFMDIDLRSYKLAFLKPLINLTTFSLCKTLPKIFSDIREVREEDLKGLEKPKHPLKLGYLRSGSKELAVPVYVDGKEVFAHHILITATTGRGKSNLLKCMLWDLVDKPYCSALVLDPHDEYYGRTEVGLKDHPSKEYVVFYTPKNPPAGAYTFKINVKELIPDHFQGVIDFSDPQWQQLHLYRRQYGESWVEAILLEKPLANVAFDERTTAVVKRRMASVLNIIYENDRFVSRGAFSINIGESTVGDICNNLEQGKTVVVDTSLFSGEVEILIGSVICSELLRRYKRYKDDGTLEQKPVVTIVLEEAPRVLGKAVLERGSNIFSTIAREGRKFKIGLTAITQLPSLIPREILANMNTKIILGIEMKPERQAIIDSAAQDLSESERAIAALDKGEAIVTSNFTRFATPIKIPFFKTLVKETVQTKLKTDFSGISQ
jgi:hypothetical protein